MNVKFGSKEYKNLLLQHRIETIQEWWRRWQDFWGFKWM